MRMEWSSGAGGDIGAVCVAASGRTLAPLCHVFFVCATFAALDCRFCVSGLSVLLLLGFFISFSVYGSSPPPHIFIFFA